MWMRIHAFCSETDSSSIAFHSHCTGLVALTLAQRVCLRVCCVQKSTLAGGVLEVLRLLVDEMKLKQLESCLGDVTQFSEPKVELEQYPTGPHIASRMLFMAENSFGDITGKSVADLGCGCGTLGIAAALLDAGQVVGVDIDEDALALAQENCEGLEVEMDFVKANLSELPLQGLLVDTVIMNPPFGTRRKGADMEFLKAALKVAGTAVYSLHKSSTRTHIKRAAVRDFGAKSADVLCELRYDLPASYKFHKQKEKDIAVDLWRFTK